MKIILIIKRMTKKDKHPLLEPTDLEIIFNGSCSWYNYYSFLYHPGLRIVDVTLPKYGNIEIWIKMNISSPLSFQKVEGR